MPNSPCHDAALELLRGGRPIVLCDREKRPYHRGWQNLEWTAETVDAHFAAVPESQVGIRLGPQAGLVDFEFDNEVERDAFYELFDGSPPRTPSYTSLRGEHHLFQLTPELIELGKATVQYQELKIRVGGGGRGAYSVVPPSDGRHWLVTLDECEPAVLSPTVIARILAIQPKVETPAPQPFDVPDDERSAMCLEALLRGTIVDGNDGSKRLHWFGCRCVEHDLNDAQVLAVFAEYNKARPFPSDWAPSDVLQRVKDAGKQAKRGIALVPSIWEAKGHTDSANAERLIRQHGDNIRYVGRWESWLCFDGKRWVKDHSCRIDHFAKQTARSLWREIAAGTGISHEVHRAATTFAKSSNNAARIHGMASLAQELAACEPEVFDADPWILNVANGTLDLKTGTLRLHAREDYQTKLAPVIFDPAAKCPTFDRFIHEIFQYDHALIGFVQRFLGHCLTGDTREQVLVVFHGQGSNGKSTLLETVASVMGSFATKMPQRFLSERKQLPNDIAMLFGTRLATCVETNEGERLDEGALKEFTGGDRLSARRCFENYFEFLPTHKLVLAANHLPRVLGTDYGIWRRMRLVPFQRQFAEHEKDTGLLNRLKAEASGILNWLLAGCRDWLANGLGEPPAVQQATQGYRIGEDVMAEFLASCCVVGEGFSVASSTLLASYKTHTGDRQMSSQRFAKLMGTRGFTKEKVTSGANRDQQMWFGLKCAKAPECAEALHS